MTDLENINARDPELIELLRGEGLPTLDLVGDSKLYFGIRGSDRRLIGAGGLEICGSSAILRSCVVGPAFKGQGVGIRLINEIIDKANQKQLTQLFLLTETAARFFLKLGFTTIDRGSVPEDVAASAQFAEICPQSAVAMTLVLSACSESDLPESDE